MVMSLKAIVSGYSIVISLAPNAVRDMREHIRSLRSSGNMGKNQSRDITRQPIRKVQVP